MKSRLLALVSSFAMVASLLFAVPVAAAAQTQPIVETVEALEAAVVGASEDDVIQVTPGSYQLTGPLVMDVANVTIEGLGSKATEVELLADNNQRVFEVSAASITISNVAIVGGRTNNSKGGGLNVATGASLDLVDVEVVGNFADEGGGLYNAGSVNVTGSLFEGNDARRKGGGIENDGLLIVVNSTITNNEGKGGGGLSTAGTANLSFVTVFSNRSTNKIGAGTLRNGGTLAVKNSIVANNVGSDGDFHDCSGTPDFENVIVTSDQGCNPEGNYDVYGPAEVVQGLPPADNGGPTRTLALLETSPAINYPGVVCVDADGVDQRGVARDSACDLGAFEFVADQTPPAVTLTTDPPANGAGWNNSPVTVTVNAVDADSEVVSVTYSATGADQIPATTVPGSTASFDIDAVGTTTVTASALDGAGNTGDADDLTINIDLTDPTVGYGAVQDDSTGDWTVTLTPGDDLSGVATFTYDVGNGETTVTDPTGPIISTITAAGPTTITYTATDAAGNTFADTQTVIIDALTLDVTLSTSSSSVQVGAVSAPLDSIVAGVAQISEQGTPVESTPFSAIPFSAITIEDAPFSAITLDDAPFSAIPFSAIPFSAIPFSAIPFSAIPFSAIPFSAIPFSAIGLDGTPFSAIGLDSVLLSELSTPDGSSLDVYLGGTPLEGTPLQALNLGDLMSVPFSAIDLDVSPFSAIPFSAIPFSAIPFSAIPFSAIGDFVDCVSLQAALSKPCEEATLGEGAPYLVGDGAGNSVLEVGDALGLDDVNLNSTVLAALPFSAIALGSVSLGGIPFSAIGSGGTELFGLEGWCDALGSQACNDFGIDPNSTADDADNGVGLITLALAGVDLNSVPFSAIDLEGLPFSAIPLGVIPFSAIDWTATPIGAVPFSAIDLGETPFSAIGDIVDCSLLGGVSACPTATLAEAQTNGAFLQGFLDTTTLALLDAFNLGDYSLADLLFGLLPAEDLPWIEIEDLNAIRLPVADGEQDPFDYVIDFTVGNRNADVDATLELPVGFVYQSATATLAGPGVASGTTIGWTESTVGTGSNPAIVLQFETLPDLDPGEYTITVPVWAGVVLGNFTAEADATATRSTGSASSSDSASITVVEGGEISSTAFLTFVGASGGCSLGSNLEVSHISSIGDIDVYEFQVPSGCTGGRVEARMTNLEADLDLTLLGPPSTANYLRGAPRSGYGYIEDHTYDLNPDDDSLDADVLRDIPIDPVKLGLPADLVPIAVSANRGTADELLEARTPRTDRNYYLVTSGYNGASTNLPFGLQAQFEGATESTCDVDPIPWLATGRALPGVGSLPSDLNTLFLYNAGSLEGSADPSAAAVLTALANVGLQPWMDLGVIGAAIPVDANGAVAATLGVWYANLNGERCDPEAANDVVRAIGQLIDGYTAARPSIANVVIVGDDAQIPFARLVDNVTYSNETDHAGTIPQAGELQSALAGGYYFSDDPYGSASGIKIADGEFFVPDRAVGRLVETPTQILGQFNDFLSYSGVLDPTTGGGTLAAAAGYDFLKDGVDEIVVNMTADGFDFGSRVLNEQGGALWTAGELVALLATSDLSVASVNAHFDQYRSLPSLGNATDDESDLFVVGDTAINRALLFSMGCHAGLNVSNVQIGGSPVWASDWAESFGGLGDLWVGNSGFGYGDSAMVAYSEAVSAAFADFIGTNTVGQAWMLAKQDFASGLFVVSPYHTKSMNEWILYGFPMFRTSADIPAQPELPPVGSGPGLIDDPYGSNLEIAPVGLASTNLQVHGVANPGKYYSGNAGTLEVRGRAVAALAEIDVTIPDGLGGLDRVAGGAIVTGLTSQEEKNFPALIFNPIVDLGDGENPSATASDRFPIPEAVFPAGLSQIADHLDEDGQLRQKLLLAGTRFDPQGDGSNGTLEKFTSFEATVYYRLGGSTDSTPPLIRLADGVSDGKIAFFEIDVAGDAVGTLDDVLRVNVLFGPANPIGEVTWRSIDLVRVGTSTTWVGGAPVDPDWGAAATEYAFWVQTCDTSANCGSSTAKGVYFATTDTGGGDVVVIDVLDSVTGNTAQEIGGWFGGPVDAVATSNAGPIDRYVLDGVAFDPADTASLTIPISANGGHFLLVYDSEGNVGARLLAIDDAPPIVNHEIDPDPTNGFSAPAGTQLLISALDPFGSGVDKIEYSFDGFDTLLSQDGPFAAIPVSVTSDVSYRAVDRVGNPSADVVVNIPIDSTPPVVAVTPGIGVTQGSVDGGWSTDSPVSVELTASDDEVQIVESVEYTLDGSTWFAYADPFDVGDEGTTTVGLLSTDVFGNTGPSDDVLIRIDTLFPTVAISSPAGPYEYESTVNAGFSCDDPGDDPSGVETCLGDVAIEQTVDTSVLGDFTFTVTATDVAGNVTVATSDYSIVDTTAPVISITTPAADPSTEVELGSAGTAASYTCTDLADLNPSCTAEVDGVPVADGQALPSNTVGTHTLTVTSIDGSGNQTTESATYTVVDTTAPVVTITTSPAPVFEDWNAGTVTVTIAAQDLSAIASIEYSLDGVTWFGDAPFDINTEGVYTIEARATDVEGNIGTATPHTVRIDLSGPTVTSDVPAEAELGEVLNVQFACEDPDGSGVASCTSEPVAGSPLDTSVPGTVSFTVTATDNVGNQTVETFSITVRYAVCLDYNPNKPQPASGAVAIKVFLCNADGDNLSDPGIDLTAEEIVVLSNGDTFNPGPNDTGSANDDFLFRYSGGRYIYNLNTTEVTDDEGQFVALEPGEYLFRFSISTTGDILYEAPFKLK